ncbi:hypothetical protein BD413DRAFT_481028 [Trametes elegans]|nr:hypothetical protein BD413DRAFT_481028 [Trametes elegans]
MFQGVERPNDSEEGLVCVTYFKSPVITLHASLEDDSAHDTSIYNLIDAYSTLSLRVKVVADALLKGNGDNFALRLFSHYADAVGRCLHRDVRFLLADPLGSLPGPGPPPVGLEERASSAQLMTTLSLYALQFVSDIFAFPALHELFTPSILQSLFEDILAIARADELSTSDGDKAISLARWTISTLRLPIPLLSSTKESILLWLTDLAPNMATNSRACDIYHHLLSEYPTVLYRETVGLLPQVLEQLVSTSIQTRINAAIAVAGYALGRLSFRSATAQASALEASAVVQRFIRGQLHRTRPPPGQPIPTHLPDYIARAVGEHVSLAGPRWAIIVICCLTILSGEGIFAGTRPLRLVLEKTEFLARSDMPAARCLTACVWRCLVWAFLQLPRDETTTQIDSDRPSARASTNPRGVLFDLIRQDLRGGVGASLVAGLLYLPAQRKDVPDPAKDIHLSWALAVLKDMICHHSIDIFLEGRTVLQRLICSVGAPADASASPTYRTWHPNDIVVKALLARCIHQETGEAFIANMESTLRFDVSAIRPLSEPEIVGHWGDILKVWVWAVRWEVRTAEETICLSNPLIQTWQALLLVQTQLTQELGHLTTPPEFMTKAVSVVARLLEQSHSSFQSAIAVQRMTLDLCNQLWGVMRHVFCEAWLATAAGSLLTAILQRTYEITHGDVKDSWSRLCSALVSASAPRLISRLIVEDEEKRLVDVRRELWRMSAQHSSTATPPFAWQDTVQLLSIPLRYWSMDESEVAVWIALVDATVEQARDTSVGSLSVFETLVQHVPEESACARLLENPAILLHLLSRVRVFDHLQHPSVFLDRVNTVLCETYSQRSERFSVGLHAVKHLRDVICECPPRFLLGLLTALSEGLPLWVADRDELLLNAEYNDAVIPLYRDALQGLQQITITSETLHSLSRFLYSAFVRIPPPGHGPVAFYEFWRHIQPSLRDMGGAYPEEIKIALRAWHDVLGDPCSQDPSFDTDTHSDSISEISPAAKSVSLTPHSAVAMRIRIHELQKTPTSACRRASPSLSPEVAYCPTPSGRPAQATDRWDDNSVISGFMPSSPTDALQARRRAMRPVSRVSHEKAARTTERPLKRQTFDTSWTSRATPPGRAGTSALSRRRSLRAPTVARGQRQSDSVDSGRGRAHAGRVSDEGASTPPVSKPKGKGKEVVRAPHLAASTARAAARAVLSPSDPEGNDYDAWEVPILADGEDIAPDSQPSDAGDDSLLPSFMKIAGRGRMLTTEACTTDDPSMTLDGMHDALPTTSTLGKRRRLRLRSLVRTRTAPTSLHDADSSAPMQTQTQPHSPGPAVRRAQTASTQLAELQHMYATLAENGSQLAPSEMAAATELTHRIGALLSEKLARRLRGEDGEVGPSDIGSGE